MMAGLSYIHLRLRRNFFFSLAMVVYLCPMLLSNESAKAPKEVDMEEVSLEEALQRIANEASLDLIYADQLLNGVNVHFPKEKQPYPERLKRILKGTDLSYKINKTKRLVLFKDPEAGSRTISGYVIAARGGGAVVGARVYVPGSLRLTRTGASGAFRLEGVPAKFDTLHVVAKGVGRRKIDLGGFGETVILVVLNQDLALSENLRVYAPNRTRLNISPLTGSISLTTQRNYLEGPPGWDLFDSLKELPGVNAGQGEAGLEFRGGQPSENLVLLDGIQLFQFDHALGSFSALNADAIGEIEVFKGGYPANYGDRLSGVMALTTRKDVFELRETRFGIDRDKMDLTFMSPLGSKLGFLVSARSSLGEEISSSAYDRNYESTFNRDGLVVGDKTGISTFRDLEFSDFIGKMSWKPTTLDQVNVTVFTGEDDIGESVKSRYVFDDIHRNNGLLSNEGMSIRWARVWNSNLQTQLLYTNSRYKSRFFKQEIDWIDWRNRYEEVNGLPIRPYKYFDTQTSNRLEDTTAQLEATWIPNDYHQIQVGVSTAHKEVSQFERAWHRTGDRIFTQETDQRTFFIQDQWQFGSKLSGQIGIRQVSNSLTNTSFSEPRVSLLYQAFDNLNFRGSWGRYHQHLLRSPDNLNYFNGVETWYLAFEFLEPGKSTQSQVGASWQRNDWNVDLEFYKRDQVGSLFRAFEPLAGGLNFRQSRDRINGVDLLVNKRVGSFSSFLGYSYQNAKVVEDITFGISQRFPTDRSRPHQVQLALNYSRGPWRTVLAWRYSTGLPYSIPEVGLFRDEDNELKPRLLPSFAPNNQRLPNTHQLDTRIQYSFGSKRFHGNIGLFLFNVYNRSNPLYRYYTLEGKSLLPVDVPGFGFRPSIRLQLVY